MCSLQRGAPPFFDCLSKERRQRFMHLPIVSEPVTRAGALTQHIAPNRANLSNIVGSVREITSQPKSHRLAVARRSPTNCSNDARIQAFVPRCVNVARATNKGAPPLRHRLFTAQIIVVGDRGIVQVLHQLVVNVVLLVQSSADSAHDCK